MSDNVVPAPAAPPRRKGHACLYGCVIALILFGVVVCVGIWGVRYGLQRMVGAFTDSAPIDVPVFDASPDQVAAFDAKWTAFREALERNEAPAPLVLTQDELNTAIANNAELDFLRGHIFLTLNGEEIGGIVSLPLEDFGIPFGKGRYFNAEATFTVFVRDGNLYVHVESATFKGQPVPDALLKNLRGENLAKNFQNQPDVQAVFEKIGDVAVRDGTLIITPRAASSEGTADLAPAA